MRHFNALVLALICLLLSLSLVASTLDHTRIKRVLAPHAVKPVAIDVQPANQRRSTKAESHEPSVYCATVGRNITIKSDTSCTDIAKKYSVGDYQVLHENPWLVPNSTDAPSSSSCVASAGTKICLVQPCNTYVVNSGDTCDSIVANNKGKTDVQAPIQLSSYNKELGNECGDIGDHVGDRICLSQNAKPNKGTNGTQTTTYAPSGTPTERAPLPSPTGPNSTADCGRWYEVQVGDICNRVCLQNRVTLDDFLYMNPELNANCSNLWLSYYYCVAPYPPITSTTSFSGLTPVSGSPTGTGGIAITPTPTSTTTAQTTQTTSSVSPTFANTYVGDPAPTNLASGSLSYDCYDYENVTTGMNCTTAEQTWSIQESDLERWNSEIDCSKNKGDLSALAGKAVCILGPVGDIPPAPVPSNAAQPPNPNCASFETAMNGDSCTAFAQRYGLTYQQFRDLNTFFNSDCSNFYAGEAYCVAVLKNGSGSTTTTGSSSPTSTTTKSKTTSTSATSDPTTAPSNVASGTPTSKSKCDLYHTVQQGENCATIAKSHSLSLGMFKSLNPELNSGCTNLYGGEAYCVGSKDTPKCTKFYTVKQGDNCAAIDKKYGITLTQFRTWNPDVNSGCTNIIVGQAYCVAASGST